MKSSIFRKLFLFNLIFVLGNVTTARGNCPDCNAKSDNKNFVKSKDLDNQLTKLIKEEFNAKNVEFCIPKKMEAEFNAKKQAIISNLNQKMTKSKTDFVTASGLKEMVNQAFEFFVDRVKYIQNAEKIRAILSNIKKDPNKANSSCMFSNNSFKTKSK